MKKIYIKPVCDTYKVVSSNPIQTSPSPVVDPKKDTDGMDAKGSNFGDFSDEED